MKEVKEKEFVAIDTKKEFTFEKLVAVVVRPSANSWAEFFRDVSLGIAGISLTIVIIIGIIK